MTFFHDEYVPVIFTFIAYIVHSLLDYEDAETAYRRVIKFDIKVGAECSVSAS